MNVSDLEAEYLQLRRALYEKFFKYTLWVFLGLFVTELFRAIIYKKIGVVILLGIIVTFGTLFIQLVCKLKKNQELVITFFFLVLYMAGLVTNYYQDTGYFSSPFNSFHYAYNTAILERLAISRIPKSSYRAVFILLTTITRGIIVPTSDYGLIAVQLLASLYGIYLDLDKDKHDKKLFDSCFRSKQQLIKFKTLVEHDIPEGILILNSNLNEALFMNNSLKYFLGIDYGSKIQDRLSEFYVKDPLPDPTLVINQGNRISSAANQNLLRLLEDNFVLGGSLSNKKISCHLTHSKSQETSGQAFFRQNEQNNKIFEVKLMDITWDEQSAIAIILHDITQQAKILELQIETDMNKDRILATVSHELRTPLNGILGMVQIMLKKVKDQELIQYLQICKNSSNLLLGLVNSILDLNQIRANKFKMFIERVHLEDLLKEILCMFEFQCIQKGLSLKLCVSPKATKYLVTDKNRLSQIFINLLGNALKFTTKGGITLTAKPARDLPEFIEFKVEDTGLGIKDEDKKKLFRTFGKLEQENELINHQGIGLGLNISENLVRLLCGTSEFGGIKVESQYGQGSAFSFLIKTNINNSSNVLNRTNIEELQESCANMSANFFDEAKSILDPKINHYQTLPIQNLTTKYKSLSVNIGQNKPIAVISSPCHVLLNKRDANQLSLSSKTSETLISTARSKPKSQTILIVDDNPFNITVATQLVQCHGYSVKSAYSGQTAIDIVQNNDHISEPIQLILMDCQMPVMDGYETTRILKDMMLEEKVPDIPIVALTASNSEAHRQSCKRAGMCDYMNKPLTDGNLLKILKKYC